MKANTFPQCNILKKYEFIFAHARNISVMKSDAQKQHYFLHSSCAISFHYSALYVIHYFYINLFHYFYINVGNLAIWQL